jgi:hypothetical protein
LFKWRGYQESTDAAGLKRKRSQGTVIVVLFLCVVRVPALAFSGVEANVSIVLHVYVNICKLCVWSDNEMFVNIKMFYFKM